MHLKMANLTFENGEAYYGQSPLRAAWRILQKSNANEDAANSLFKNLGIAGILSDKTKDAELLTQEQLDTMDAKWRAKFAGSLNAGKVWMTNRDVAWQNIGISPVDMALIQDYGMNLRTLAGIYKVSSTLFNDQAAATESNVKEKRKAAYTDAILPMVNAFCDSFNKWIAQSYAASGEYIELYPITDNIPELQEDKAALAAWLNTAYWVQFNEKRVLTGFDEDPTKDGLYLIPSNLMTIEDISAPFEGE
jgi:HK97 family phage portal protein